MGTASLVPVTVPLTLLLPAAISADARYELLTGALHLSRMWPNGVPEEWRERLDTMPWDVPAELRRLGFREWCSGYERVVFFHPSGWCLKAPIGRDGIIANRDELQRLASLPVAEQEVFAETYGLPGDILLQRRYEVDPERVEAMRTGRDDILAAQVRLHVHDVTPTNIGWTRTGGWVFLDWAGGEDRPLPATRDLWADESGRCRTSA